MASDSVELARWRHFSDATIDGQSIRSVLVSFVHNCTSATTSDYVVRWGVARALNANTGVTPANVASFWGAQARPVDGESPYTDNYSVDASAAPVLEPHVWVSLARDWLLKANIRGPMSPIRSAQISDFLGGYMRTYVNDDAADVTSFENEATSVSGLIDWSTEVEGWLYDRPFALWNTYIQTGDARWLRHAHRASQFYASWVASNTDTTFGRGSFRKRIPSYVGDMGDAKYSHGGGMFAAYLLTGDARLLDKIRAVGEFTSDEINASTRLFPYTKTNGLWTERQLTAALAGQLYAWEATGDTRFKARAAEIVAGMQADVSAPPLGYPTAADMSGVLLHRPEVHDGDSTPDMIMSPWMSALLGDALWHYYMLSDDNVALTFLSNYALFVANRSIYNDPTGGELASYWVPWYITGLKAGYTDSGVWDDVEHARDVLGLLARGRWARQQLGLSTALLDTQITRLTASAIYDFNAWHRSTAGLPRYRLSPTRKAGWWFGTTTDLAWFGLD